MRGRPGWAAVSGGGLPPAPAGFESIHISLEPESLLCGSPTRWTPRSSWPSSGKPAGGPIAVGRPTAPGRSRAVTRRTLSRTKPDILGEGDARGIPSPVPKHRAQPWVSRRETPPKVSADRLIFAGLHAALAHVEQGCAAPLAAQLVANTGACLERCAGQRVLGRREGDQPARRSSRRGVW